MYSAAVLHKRLNNPSPVIVWRRPSGHGFPLSSHRVALDGAYFLSQTAKASAKGAVTRRTLFYARMARLPLM